MTEDRSTWMSALAVAALMLGLAAPCVWTEDEILFSNGDKRYGKVIELRENKWRIELEGRQLVYARKAIQSIAYNKIVDPAPYAKLLHDRREPPAGVAPLLQRATGTEVDVSVRPLGDDRKLTLIVEKGIELPYLALGTLRTSFFGRTGCYVSGRIQNASEALTDGGFGYPRIRGYDFTMHLYAADDSFLGSHRFHLYEFPVGRPQPFTVHIPILSPERVAKVRVTRRF